MSSALALLRPSPAAPLPIHPRPLQRLLRIDRSAGTAGLSVATTVGTSTALALVLLLSSVAIRRARNWSRSRPAIELRSRWHPLQHFFTTAAIDTTRLAEAGFPTATHGRSRNNERYGNTIRKNENDKEHN